MIVGFWQGSPGHGCTTTNCLSVALKEALAHNLKVVVLQTKFRNNNLSYAVLGDVSEIADNRSNDNGIDGLLRLQKSGKNTIANVEAITHSFYENLFNVIYGTTKTNHRLYEEEMLDYLPGILKTLSQIYDIVFLDIEAGDSELTRLAKDCCDYLVCCLEQNRHNLEHLFSDYEFDLSKTLFLIGSYKADLHLNYRNMLKLFPKLSEANLLYLSYCEDIANACNNASILDFFLLNSALNPKHMKKLGDSAYKFMDELGKVTKILNSLIIA